MSILRCFLPKDVDAYLHTALLEKSSGYKLKTFAKIPCVQPTNNFAEQQICPSVIIRKNSFHTMSDLGTETHSILMTLELQKKDEFEETKKLVQLYTQNQLQNDKLAVAA